MLDPYLYPGTQILKNKWNIRMQEQVDQLEAEFVSSRIREEIQNPLPGNFDFEHLCNLHFYMFQDIYEWAGQPRIINIEKAEPALGGISIEYAEYYDIKRLATAVLQNMNRLNWSDIPIDQRAKKLSESMAELWHIHSFREGNTRTVVTFCCHFAESREIPLETALFEKHSAYVRTALVAATAVFKDLGDHSNPTYLERIVLDSLQQGYERRQEIGKKPPRHSIRDKLAETKAECAQRAAEEPQRTRERDHKSER